MADPKPESGDLRSAIIHEQLHLLDAAITKWRHCTSQLSDEQLWWRPQPGHNSIANLMLHVSGNLRQWIICGVGGESDQRDRAAEFSATGGVSATELWAVLDETLDEVRAVLEAATNDSLLSLRTIQGFQVTGLGAIVHSVSHFVGHTHQTILLTRLQLGEAYRFEWSPDRSDEDVPI